MPRTASAWSPRRTVSSRLRTPSSNTTGHAGTALRPLPATAVLTTLAAAVVGTAAATAAVHLARRLLLEIEADMAAAALVAGARKPVVGLTPAGSLPTGDMATAAFVVMVMICCTGGRSSRLRALFL